MKVGDLVKDKWGHLGIIVNKREGTEAGRWMVYWFNICEFWELYDCNLEVVNECG